MQEKAVVRTVHGIVHPFVDPVNLSAVLFGVQVELRVGREVVELAVQHADDLGRLVVDDSALLRVPQHRHRPSVRGAEGISDMVSRSGKCRTV